MLSLGVNTLPTLAVAHPTRRSIPPHYKRKPNNSPHQPSSHAKTARPKTRTKRPWAREKTVFLDHAGLGPDRQMPPRRNSPNNSGSTVRRTPHGIPSSILTPAFSNQTTHANRGRKETTDSVRATPAHILPRGTDLRHENAKLMVPARDVRSTWHPPPPRKEKRGLPRENKTKGNEQGRKAEERTGPPSHTSPGLPRKKKEGKTKTRTKTRTRTKTKTNPPVKRMRQAGESPGCNTPT